MCLARLSHQFILLTMLCLFIIPSLSTAQKALSITTGRGAPFVTPDHNGFFDLIVKDMFQRIGLKAQTVLLPSARSLINANNGIDDGNIARVKGIEKKYTNLVMVPEKVIDFEFTAYSKNTQIKIKNWQSLADYNLAFVNGWIIFKKKVTAYKSLLKTRDSEQLFMLLSKNRIDIALYDAWWNKGKNTGILKLAPPLASFKLYLYVHKKHKDLVNDLAKALQAMKQDGSYQRIYNQTLNTPHFDINPTHNK